MNTPLVSVIIPTYNRGLYIMDAVRSVLDQDYGALELIVVDDGSTDGTAEILADYKDSRMKVVCQSNRGVSAARNAGIGIAGGEFVALLDSDDYWLPHKLVKQVAYMRNQDYSISQTGELWYRKGKRVNAMDKHAKHEGWLFERSLDMCMISPSCVMFTRDLWKDVGPFDADFPACEDYDLWLRVCLKYPVGLVPEALVAKRGGRSDQLSNSVPCLDFYRLRSMARILDEPLADVQRSQVLETLVRRGNVYVSGCRKRGRTQEAEKIWNLICKARNGVSVFRDFPRRPAVVSDE